MVDNAASRHISASHSHGVQIKSPMLVDNTASRHSLASRSHGVQIKSSILVDNTVSRHSSASRSHGVQIKNALLVDKTTSLLHETAWQSTHVAYKSVSNTSRNCLSSGLVVNTGKTWTMKLFQNMTQLHEAIHVAYKSMSHAGG